MAVQQTSEEAYLYETERKPNLYASWVLAGVACVILIVFLLNELHVFEVDRVLVHLSLSISIIILLLMNSIVRKPRYAEKPITKYVMLSMVLLFVLTVTILLNIHAILAFVLPLLLATQYRSRRFSHAALAGSCFCCGVAPILSYLLGTWSLTFMTGYIQTFCRVTISIVPGSNLGMLESIKQITLYWSMPQMLILLAFGFILFSVTRSGIDSVQNHMRVLDLSKSLAQQLESIEALQGRVLYSISDIIESRDIETGSHARRTSEIVRMITSAMLNDPNSGVNEVFCDNLIKCAPMHDLGKIAVPDTILRKPGRLTPEEYEIVKQHPIKSAMIIEKALTGVENEELLIIAKNIAMYHHERMDGKGYPSGLIGEAIPLEARIMAIVDVYDALVCKRCYKEPMSFEQAFQTIEDAMGTQFDKKLNPYLIQCRSNIEHFYQSIL